MNSAHLWLISLSLLSACAYIAIAAGGQSLHEEGSGGHSLLVVLGLFAVCFACYLAAIRLVLRSQADRTSLAIILGGAVLFRGLLLFSDPIEEIDLYRYLWDGAASTSGVNPFRYTPQQILAADGGDELPADLARLVALRDRSPALAEILGRVHFGELPTIYPPVSQIVFALAVVATPETAGVPMRMTIMKAWFVLFDLMTLAIVVGLLRRMGRPSTEVVVYAWCPLVIKEIANSGHLDSLAVFLTTLSFYVALKALFPPDATAHLQALASGTCERAGGVDLRYSAAIPSLSAPTTGTLTHAARLCGAAVLLGLAVGAKLYPVVLAPLLFCGIAVRRGSRTALAAALVFVATTFLVLLPMLPGRLGPAWKPPKSVEQAGADLAPLPPEEIDLAPRDPSQSVRAFLSYWEMNDFLFLLIMENIRPTDHLPASERAWFSFVPESWRAAFVERIADHLSLDGQLVPFVFTRAATTVVFVLLASFFAWRAARCSAAEDFLRYAFLTIAWFWLLLPTGNPWYWTWVMPLLPFARSRVWLALSGLVMLYYLRFWLVYHFPDPGVLGTCYAGGPFFDYVVTWLEYGPFFIALCCLRTKNGN